MLCRDLDTRHAVKCQLSDLSLSLHDDWRSVVRCRALLCNLVGFFLIVVGGPIYLALLSTPSNSLYARATVYALFMSVYPALMLLRALLSLPMFCTLLRGENPIWHADQGYQRIDDAANTRQRRTNRRTCPSLSPRTQMRTVYSFRDGRAPAPAAVPAGGARAAAERRGL